MERYRLSEKIGSGTYGTVYKVHPKTSDDEVFALKVFRSGSSYGLVDATIRELSCLMSLQGHPYVVYLHKVMLYNRDVASLMTYYPYTVYTVIRRSVAVPTSVTARISVQVAQALAYMHDLNWIHRDLTPSNVMLTEDLTVKVGDMGLSRNAAGRMSSDTVTMDYRAPELLACHEPTAEYTSAIDMWSLGVLIAELVERRSSLFRDKNVDRVKYTTNDIVKRVFDPEKTDTSTAAVFSAERMLQRVLQRESVKNVVFGLLKMCPNARLTAHQFLSCEEWRSLSEAVTPKDVRLVLDVL